MANLICHLPADSGRMVAGFPTQACDGINFVIIGVDSFVIRDQDLAYLGYIPESGPAPIAGFDYFGGSYGSQSAHCSHTELPLEEAVALCVGEFGGSFQTLFERLEAKGYKLVKAS